MKDVFSFLFKHTFLLSNKIAKNRILLRNHFEKKETYHHLITTSCFALILNPCQTF